MSKKASKLLIADATGSNCRSRTRGNMSEQEPYEETELRARLVEAKRRMAELISEKERSDGDAELVHKQLQDTVEESRFHRSEAESLQAQF